MQEMWQYPIGTVVRSIPTEDEPEVRWGHVMGFRKTALGQNALDVLWAWQSGPCSVVLTSDVEVQS